MNKYIIDVSADIPYPWPKKYEENATNEGAAIARALRRYRTDVRNRCGRSRKITAASVKYRNCGRVMKGEEANNG